MHVVKSIEQGTPELPELPLSLWWVIISIEVELGLCLKAGRLICEALGEAVDAVIREAHVPREEQSKAAKIGWKTLRGVKIVADMQIKARKSSNGSVYKSYKAVKVYQNI